MSADLILIHIMPVFSLYFKRFWVPLSFGSQARLGAGRGHQSITWRKVSNGRQWGGHRSRDNSVPQHSHHVGAQAFGAHLLDSSFQLGKAAHAKCSETVWWLTSSVLYFFFSLTHTFHHSSPPGSFPSKIPLTTTFCDNINDLVWNNGIGERSHDRTVDLKYEDSDFGARHFHTTQYCNTNDQRCYTDPILWAALFLKVILEFLLLLSFSSYSSSMIFLFVCQSLTISNLWLTFENGLCSSKTGLRNESTDWNSIWRGDPVRHILRSLILHWLSYDGYLS